MLRLNFRLYRANRFRLRLDPLCFPLRLDFRFRFRFHFWFDNGFWLESSHSTWWYYCPRRGDNGQTDAHLRFSQPKQAFVTRIQYFNADRVGGETELSKTL